MPFNNSIHTLPAHTLSIDTIARGQNVDQRFFLQLDDRQSVDYQAYKVVSSLSKLPGAMFDDWQLDSAQ